MVGSTLALRLYEQRHIRVILAVPSREWLQLLKSVACRRYDDFDITGIFCWRNEAFVVNVKSPWREHVAFRLVKSHCLSVLIDQQVMSRIKVKSSGNSQCYSQLRRANECKCIRIAIGTAAEVSVEGCHYGILPVVIIGMAVPLSDTRTASICHDNTSDRLQVIDYAVTLCSIVNLL